LKFEIKNLPNKLNLQIYRLSGQAGGPGPCGSPASNGKECSSRKEIIILKNCKNDEILQDTVFPAIYAPFNIRAPSNISPPRGWLKTYNPRAYIAGNTVYSKLEMHYSFTAHSACLLPQNAILTFEIPVF